MSQDERRPQTADLEAGYGDVTSCTESRSRPARRLRLGDRAERRRQVDAAEDDLRALPPRKGSVASSRRSRARHHRARAEPLTGLGLNYVPQLDNVFPSMSVLENLEIGAFLRPDAPVAARQGVRVVPAAPGAPPAARGNALGRRAADARARAGADDRAPAAPARRAVGRPRARRRRCSSRGSWRSTVGDRDRDGRAEREEVARAVGLRVRARHGPKPLLGPGPRLLHDQKVVDLYLGGRGRLAAAKALAGEDYEARSEAG